MGLIDALTILAVKCLAGAALFALLGTLTIPLLETYVWSKED